MFSITVQTTGLTGPKIFMVVSSTLRMVIGYVTLAFKVTGIHHHPKVVFAPGQPFYLTMVCFYWNHTSILTTDIA